MFGCDTGIDILRKREASIEAGGIVCLYAMTGRRPQAIFIMACILSVYSFALAGFGSGHLLTLCRSRTNRRKRGGIDPHLLFELRCHIAFRNPLTDPRVDQEARPQANTDSSGTPYSPGNPLDTVRTPLSGLQRCLHGVYTVQTVQ